MSDPVLALVLIVSLLAALAAVRYFKTLELDFWGAARTPLAAGLVAGALLWLGASRNLPEAPTAGIVMTLTALWVRHTGRESEAADGMLLGALAGVAAALPLAFSGEHELRWLAEGLLAGSVAGYGITFAAFHVAARAKQLLLDVVTAALAVGAAFAPQALAGAGLPDRNVALAASAAIPLLGVATVFKQWPSIKGELGHEAALGFMSDSDVRRTAHPLLRLGRGGWLDGQAHREFVRLANRIALRKRQQRGRPDEVARIYQLEIIKLRMQLQEMTAIDRAARQHAAAREGATDGQGGSDTMAGTNA
jgi:hypothetical protein